MFVHNDTISHKAISVQDTPKGRYYTTPQGAVYPSITTLLGHKEKPWLQEWRTSLGEVAANKEMQRAADRGTAVHFMAEKYLNNHPNPTENQPKETAAEFHSLKLLLKKVNNIYAQEIPLYSNILKVAGRADCIAEWDGVLSVVDFKTSTNDKYKQMIEDYYLQTTAYALMFDEVYNIQIDNIVIVMSVEKGIVPLVFKAQVETWIEPLIERINTFYLSKR